MTNESTRRSMPSMAAADRIESRDELIEEVTRLRRRIAALEAGSTAEADALRSSEELYRSLYHDIPLMYFKLDDHGVVLSVNTHGAESLGYALDELVGQSVLKVFHPDHRAEVEQRLGAFVAQPDEVAKWEFMKVRKDGSTLWVHETVRGSRRADGALEVLVVCEDITERRKTEAKILEHQRQLEALTAALAMAEERERRRIGRGLHDEIAQLLAMARMNLGKLETAATPGERAELIVHCRDLIDRSIQTTRTLIFELASPALYELGLSAGLDELGEWVEREGLAFRFDSDDSCRSPNGEIDAVVFRAVRELVHNVIKHASARSIAITLATRDGEIHVMVTDDGRGFDAGEAGMTLGAREGFGLFSIRQHLEQVGGRIEFRSQPGQGTQVEIRAPVQSDPSPPSAVGG